MQILYGWLAVAAVTLCGILSAETLVHWFQLESYQFPGYFKTLKRNAVRAILPGLIGGAVMGVLWIVLDNAVRESNAMLLFLAGLAMLIAGAGMGFLLRKTLKLRKAKKPLVYTARVKRLHGVMAVVFALLTATLYAVARPAMGFFPVLLPLWVALAGLLAWPIEKLISELYFRDAQRLLRERPDLIKIGITGSYGKTSVKFILGTLLSEKYQTLVTPSSFNTPMGLTSVIRGRLSPSHQVFVAEMGARHVGDIKELCRLVHPTYGVLTSVGPQHLDTFKTLERIKNTKYELMDAIPADGCCFFPDDGAICRELYDRTEKEKRLCALRPGPDCDVWAERVTVSAEGSSFRLCTREESVDCHTRLLGEHNIQNIVLAATVCLRLGLTMKQIARGITKLQPVEHRLQLLPNAGGFAVIDDAFNSNPSGAACALKVLSGFTGGQRIIITPGMVELGEKEADYNRAFGEQMASCADIAILVGRKHAAPIADGLRAMNFPEESIHMTGSLDEAAALMRSIVRPGDTVMFENDLPDNYSEE